MTSLDFTAAQRSLLTRRRLRAAEAQARLESRQICQASRASTQTLVRQAIEAWDAIKGREGTRPDYRVGQLDTELLDEELLELLKGQVGEALKFFGSHLRDEWASEILFVLRAVLFKLTIWDHNASYGAYLQNLKYTDARQRGPVAQPPSKWQKACCGLLTVGGRYAWTKWEAWLAELEGGYEQPSSNVRFFSQISAFVSTTHSIAAFASFLIFLLNGRYRTVLDRILCLRLVPPTNQVSREISFEYLNRQLVWHAFTEFLLFFLPLVGISRWRRWLSRVWRKTRTLIRANGADEYDDTGPKGDYAFLPERTCAICYQDQNPTSASENEVRMLTGASGGVGGSAQTDVTNPYETLPCECVYCFVCIATRLEFEEGDGWICLRCGTLVKECQPWAGDVALETTIAAHENIVGFPGGENKRNKQTFFEGEATGSIEEKANQAIANEGYESRERARQGSVTSGLNFESKE